MEILQDVTTIPLETPSALDPFRLIAESGPVSTAVLVILGIFSLVSWAIILSKWFVYRKAEAQSRVFLDVFRRSKKFSEVRSVCKQLNASPLVGVFLAGYNELDYQLRAREKENQTIEMDERQSSRIKSLESVGRSLVRSTNIEVMKLESRLGFLATTGSATPFIGLFGTVWGIMNAFSRIGVVQAANISVVAPGVSEALIATAAGLAAAIPAVIFYNYYANWVKRLSTGMDDFSLKVLDDYREEFHLIRNGESES